MEYSSKFSNLYKSHNFKEGLQEKRRQQLLNEQKQKRNKLQDNLRGIESFVKNLHRRKQKQYHLSYSEKYNSDYSLQLSEWLKEKPEDLECWYLVPCPKGKRCLIVANNGITEVYTRNGKYLKSFHSMLPGDGISRQNLTILDCIFIHNSSTYYVLDVLIYANQDFINCETEFRFFWIKSRFLDIPMINNEYSFIPLPYYGFEDESAIASCLFRYPQWDDENLILDGFLFYHKEASYTCGTTPLVGWLFGFMIPEILNIDVNKEYMKEKPEDYVDYLHYMTIFDEKMAKRNNRNKKKCKKMESDDDSIETTNLIDNSNDTYGDNNSMEILIDEETLELEGRLNDIEE